MSCKSGMHEAIAQGKSRNPEEKHGVLDNSAAAIRDSTALPNWDTWLILQYLF